MKTLVLDTSTAFLYVAIIDDGQELFSRVAEGKNNHSDNLIPTIKEGLESLGMTMKDIKRIVVGIGPGSYTGLRIALTVAKTFSWTLNIPLFTASSLDILGSGYLSEDGIYAITSFAKKNHLYGKLLEVKNGQQHVLIDDTFMEETEFFKAIGLYCYYLVNENNYLFHPGIVKTEPVRDVHLLTPNYLRKELS